MSRTEQPLLDGDDQAHTEVTQHRADDGGSIMDSSRGDDRYQLLPPLSSAEYESLKEDIRLRGVLVPIVVDEHNAVLDGHHRHQACQELGITDIPRDVRAFESEEEKRAYVYSINLARRQLSPEQTEDVREEQGQLAGQLRDQGKAQEEVAKILGVDQSTVSRWLSGSNMHVHNASEALDLRLTVPKSEHLKIAAREARGDSAERIAADYKISARRVRQILDQAERPRASQKEARSKTSPESLVAAEGEAAHEPSEALTERADTDGVSEAPAVGDSTDATSVDADDIDAQWKERVVDWAQTALRLLRYLRRETTKLKDEIGRGELDEMSARTRVKALEQRYGEDLARLKDVERQLEKDRGSLLHDAKAKVRDAFPQLRDDVA